jgi:hypothetical protein
MPSTHMPKKISTNIISMSALPEETKGTMSVWYMPTWSWLNNGKKCVRSWSLLPTRWRGQLPSLQYGQLLSGPSLIFLWFFFWFGVFFLASLLLHYLPVSFAVTRPLATLERKEPRPDITMTFSHKLVFVHTCIWNCILPMAPAPIGCG